VEEEEVRRRWRGRKGEKGEEKRGTGALIDKIKGKLKSPPY
jgi:hypothetical protein